MSAAVIQATYCGFRTVAGRKQLQMTFEVPIEHSAKVLAALGSPSAIDPTWVAIALLDPALMKEGAQAPVTHSSPTEDRNEEPPANAGLDRERTPWRDLPPAKQAGIRCAEVAFWRFLEAEIQLAGGWIASKDTAADYLRRQLGVASRGELQPGTPAASAWKALNDRYEAWVRS